MGRLWTILFLLVPILGIGMFVWAPGNQHWLPVDISEHGHKIDSLFMFILLLTGVVFAITEFALVWFMWKYDAAHNAEPVKYTHGSHNLELLWTIVPALTLIFIAFVQMSAWADVKLNQPNQPPIAEVTARQFEWRIKYPGPDGKLGTPDDIHHLNDLHLPVDTDVVIDLKSMDVLHDFFLPHLRVKQDAVPGMKIPVWFRSKELGMYDLVCAELCGWGHYKMKGRVTFESRAQFDAWLAQLAAEQEATQ